MKTRAAHDDWVQCPRGELGRLTARLRGRRQRRLVVGVSTVLIASAIALSSFQWAASLVGTHASPSATSCHAEEVSPADACPPANPPEER